MIVRTLAALAVVAAALLSARGASAGAELSDRTYEQWRDFVRPKESELRWLTAIPWRPSLWDGAIEANEQQKPLLMWTMNGHPLACT